MPVFIPPDPGHRKSATGATSKIRVFLKIVSEKLVVLKSSAGTACQNPADQATTDIHSMLNLAGTADNGANILQIIYKHMGINMSASLFERLGGTETITKISGDLVEIVLV